VSGGAPLGVHIEPDPKHGHVIRVSLGAATGAARDQLAAAVSERLGPLTVRHAVD